VSGATSPGPGISLPGDGPYVAALEEILDWSRRHESRLGYFAALYWHVEVTLEEALKNGQFDHPEWIEALNTVFFQRYLDAAAHFRAGEPATAAWQVAFDALASPHYVVVQHLLLGANAHIDFDLAIATAEAIRPADMAAFRPDYDRMNGLLESLVNDLNAELSRVWPLLKWISRIGGPAEDAVIGFSMRLAREDAWNEAQLLSAMDPAKRDAAIKVHDAKVAALARDIEGPGFLAGLVIAIIRWGEHGSVSQIIDDLLGPAGTLADPVASPVAAPPASPVAAPPAAPPSDPAPKRRIAVLGGGQAALTAALQLTDPANPAHTSCDVTIYQIGWRLGGKGATGRPKDEPWAHDRIEEHGLHNWFGFYDNAFRQMRSVYTELGRPPTAPLATFDEAFEGANEAVFVEHIKGKPRLWTVENITNDASPGEGGLWLSPWVYIGMAIDVIRRLLGGSPAAQLGQGHPVLTRAHQLLVSMAADRGVDLEGASLATADDLLATAIDLLDKLEASHTGPDHPLVTLFDDLKDELEHELDDAATVPPWIRALDDAPFRALSWMLWLFMSVLWEAVRTDILTAAKDSERRLWIGANLGYACMVGALADGVIDGGFDVLNHLDFRAWITLHAYADGGVMLDSPLVEAVYTASFAYPNGDSEMPPGASHPTAENMEAGTALRGFVRTAFTYKGSFAYRFTAGTADTCYAPIYEVLARRGVRFRFFQRVDHLEVEDGRIARIVVAEQAAITPEQQAAGGYAPLLDIRGLPCWPSTPCWEQLVDGDWFQSVAADFECPTAEVRGRERAYTLAVDQDFDDVVLGISLAALPWVAAELLSQSGAWTDAVTKIKTVRTQALQLWLSQSTRALGFGATGHPIVTWLFDEWSPLNVWGEYSELLPMEGWPVVGGPQSLDYFCSTMPDGTDPPEPFPDQVAADALVRQNALEMLDQGLGQLLPQSNSNGMFDWNLMLDLRPAPGSGSTRLDSQYYRANVVPTERYVLSVAGSSQYRLPVHDPVAFPNLYLAGDWTECTLNCGCMEAATMSGMLCANALTGYPPRADITGVDF